MPGDWGLSIIVICKILERRCMEVLKECLDVFGKWIDEKGVRVITDAYIPKDGTYRLIQITDSGFQIMTTLDIYYDRKKGEVLGSENSEYGFVSILDYYSKLLEMNKSVDSSKVIHTNSYLSFAVKKESIQNHKLTNEIIKNYYQVLKKPEEKYKDKNTKKLYETVVQEIGKPDVELIEKIEIYMLEMLKENNWDGIDLNKKDYIKLFFVFSDKEETKKYYEKENRRYIIPKLYNNNKFNITLEDGIFGLSNNNMNMNEKKPYLENKTRKISIPNLISQKQALLQNQMFDYFMTQVSKGKNCIYIINHDEESEIRAYKSTEEPESMENGYYLRMKKEKNEVSIEQADVIVDYNSDLKIPFVLEDRISLSERVKEKKDRMYRNYDKLWEIKEILDLEFFEGKLKYGFDTEAKDLSFKNGDVIKQCFLLGREQMINWFWKGIDTYIPKVLDDITLRLIKNSILRNQVFTAQHQFNIRWSLLNYFNEERKAGENMSQIRSALREHINMSGNAEWEFSSDDEFAYAVGQAVSYLLSLSNANEKDEACINAFLDAKDIKVIRNKLMQLYKRYNYKIIHNKDIRFRKMAAAIMEYETKKINNELIMAGFVSSSLIYEKKNNE